MRTELSPHAIRQAAADFLHWREQNGGAVRWRRYDRRKPARLMPNDDSVGEDDGE